MIHSVSAGPRWDKHPNPAVRERAQRAVDFLRNEYKTKDPQTALHSLAAIVTPIVLDVLELDDVWDGVYDQFDWTDGNAYDHSFKLPPEYVGFKQVLQYANGVALPVLTMNQKFITAFSEEIATPAFPFDPAELERPDAIGTLQDFTDAATRMIQIKKARQGYWLTGDGMDTSGTNLTVVVDDGSYIASGIYKTAAIKLREAIEKSIFDLQDSMGNDVPIKLLARQITLNEMQRVGLFGRSGTDDTFLDQVRVNPSLQPTVLPGGTDDLEGWAVHQGRRIFTEGDVLLLGPRIGAYALTRKLQPSTITREHWAQEMAWRMGYAWTRWSDKGDLRRMRRILFIADTNNGGATAGDLVLDGLWTTGASFYCTRPVKKSTITNANIIISASSNGGQATGSLSATLRGDLRHFKVDFGSALTPGTQYFVRSTTSLHDLSDSTVNALPEVTATCAG